MATRRLFDGAQIEIGSLPIEGGVAGGVTGSGNITLDAAIVTGTGTLGPAPITGTGNITLGSLTIAGAGTVSGGPVTGTGNIVLGALTISGTGVVPVPPAPEPRRRRGSIVFEDKRKKPPEPDRIEAPQAEEQHPAPEIRPIVPSAPMPVKASIAEIAGLTPTKIAQMKTRIAREQEDEDDLEALLMIL